MTATKTNTNEKEIIAAAHDAVAELSACFDALPNDADLATPREQDRVSTQRSLYIGLRGRLRNGVHHYCDFESRLQTWRLWQDTLRACHIEFERALKTLTDLSASE